MLKLDRDPDIDLDFIMSSDLSKGIFRHLDILVLPDSIKDVVVKYLSGEQLTDFMNNGGKVIASGEVANMVPDHKNAVKLPRHADIKKYIIK